MKTKSAQQYSGSCLCGDVSFSVSGFADKIAHCHCSMCRKFHGAAFGTLSPVKNLTWLSGESLLTDYVAENGTTRTFCRQCGSSIGFRCKGEPLERIELALNLSEGELPVHIDAHIYTQYKSDWDSITDELPQFKEGRPSSN